MNRPAANNTKPPNTDTGQSLCSGAWLPGPWPLPGRLDGAFPLLTPPPGEGLPPPVADGAACPGIVPVGAVAEAPIVAPGTGVLVGATVSPGAGVLVGGEGVFVGAETGVFVGTARHGAGAPGLSTRNDWKPKSTTDDEFGTPWQ